MRSNICAYHVCRVYITTHMHFISIDLYTGTYTVYNICIICMYMKSSFPKRNNHSTHTHTQSAFSGNAKFNNEFFINIYINTYIYIYIYIYKDVFSKTPSTNLSLVNWKPTFLCLSNT